MKQDLKNEISKWIELSDEEMELVLNLFEEKTIKKNNFLIDYGKRGTEIAFIQSGILKTSFINNNNEKILYFPNSLKFIIPTSSFLSKSPSRYSIKAITDVHLLVISFKNIAFMHSNIPNTRLLTKLLFEYKSNFYNSKIISILTKSANERYQILFDLHPEILKNVSVKDLAIFLNITSQHLSRLRK